MIEPRAEAFDAFIELVSLLLDVSDGDESDVSSRRFRIALLEKIRRSLKHANDWSVLLRRPPMRTSDNPAVSGSEKGTTLPVTVTNVRLFRLLPADVQSEPVVSISCVVNNILLLEGIALHRTAEEGLTLRFPIATDAVGRRIYLSRPVDDRTHQSIKEQVFAARGIDPNDSSWSFGFGAKDVSDE